MKERPLAIPYFQNLHLYITIEQAKHNELYHQTIEISRHLDELLLLQMKDTAENVELTREIEETRNILGECYSLYNGQKLWLDQLKSNAQAIEWSITKVSSPNSG